MPDSGERTVIVAHCPTEIQPWLQMPCLRASDEEANRDHGHRLEAGEASNSAIGADDATAVMAKKELAKHGARSVTTVMDGTTTGWSAGKLPKAKPMVVHAQGNSRGKARPNLLAKQRSTLTPWCLRRSFQEEKGNYFLMWMQIKTRSLQERVYL